MRRAGSTSRIEGVHFAEQGAWLVATLPKAGRAVDSLDARAQGIGPWRLLPCGARVFELPRCCITEADHDDPAALHEEIVEWASATARGVLPHDWAPLGAAELEQALPAGQRAFRTGSRLCHVELVSTASQLALQLRLAEQAGEPATELAEPAAQLAGEVAGDLRGDLRADLRAHPADPARERWLRTLLLEAQRLTRFVRWTFSPQTRAIVTSVDLSGAPASLQVPLLEAARAALSAAVGRMHAPITLLSNRLAHLRFLELMP